MRDKLTDIAIRNAKRRAKEFKLSDGAGLHLLIKPNGSKLWRFRFRFNGTENMLGFGTYELGSPEHVPLATARARRDEARKLLEEGKNPSGERKLGNCAAASSGTARGQAVHSFESVGRQWIASKKKVLSQKYAGVIERRMERLLYPRIGGMDIGSITGPDLLRAIKEIEEDGVYLARRMKMNAGQVFRYAVAHGWAERDPSRDIKEGLSARPRVKHRAFEKLSRFVTSRASCCKRDVLRSLKASELPESFKRLETYYDGYEITKLALHFIIFAAVRTDELRFAPWCEIEELGGEAPLWRIPPERMKKPRPHLVPLAPQAVTILKRARELYPDSKLIFPSQESRTGVMSENCLLYALYHLGYKSKATVHGFRSTFSTVLNENGFSGDWIELQLAHAEDDETRAAYNAAQWLPQRRQMMCWWANFVDNATQSNIK
jgi:integrase